MRIRKTLVNIPPSRMFNLAFSAYRKRFDSFHGKGESKGDQTKVCERQLNCSVIAKQCFVYSIKRVDSFFVKTKMRSHVALTLSVVTLI